MQLIPLSRGLFAKVSDEDFDWLSEFNWHAVECYPGKMYARRHFYFPQRCRTVFMHRLILCPLPDEIVDHQDRDGLNNCRSNLRFCTDSQNQANAKLARVNTSGFRGVSWHAKRGHWISTAKVNGKNHYLVAFTETAPAAKAYDEFIVNRFGPFALTNQALGLLKTAAEIQWEALK